MLNPIGTAVRAHAAVQTTTAETAEPAAKATTKKDRDGVLDGVILGALFLGGNPVAMMPNASGGAKVAGAVVGMAVGGLLGGCFDAMIQDNDPGKWGPFDDYLKF